MERPNRPQGTRPQNRQQGNPNMQMQGNPNMQNMQMQGNPNMQQKINMQKKKKGKGKIILIVILALIGVSVLGYLTYLIATGRISSRVTDLESEVAGLESRIEEMNSEHAEEVSILKQEIEDTTVKELLPTTSLQRVEASNVPQLWLREGDFIAPNPLNIEGTSEAINDSYLQVGQIFCFRPSDRWLICNQGATCEFSHPQKIWGKIRALNIDEPLRIDAIKTILTDYFVGYPATEIDYRKVYYEDINVGMIAKAAITVKIPTEEKIKTEVTQEEAKTLEEKDMILNVGYVNVGENSLSFMFIYDAEGGSNSQELVELLLRSATVGSNGERLKLE